MGKCGNCTRYYSEGEEYCLALRTSEGSLIRVTPTDGCTTHFEDISGVDFVTDCDNTANNGGETDYYKFSNAPFPINDVDDLAEWRNMDFFQSNILKVACTFNVGRHSATDELRELNKIGHYVKRRKNKILRNKG